MLTLYNSRHSLKAYKWLMSCVSSILDVNLSRTNIVVFGWNKKKSNQEGSYLGDDRIETTDLDIDFYSYGYLPSRLCQFYSKR